MTKIYLPVLNQPKSISYHYQTADPFIANLLFLGTLFRALPYFPQVYVKKTLLSQKLQSLLISPTKLLFTQPKTSNFHTITISSRPNPKADLISTISINQSNSESKIISITGNGKGKTTLGLGLILFNYLNQSQITSYHFFKDPQFATGISEFNFPKFLIFPFVMHSQSTGFLLPHTYKDQIHKHQQSTQRFLASIKKSITSKKYDFILLDEAIDALIADLINQSDIKNLISLAKQNNAHLVLTGRYTNLGQFNISNFFDTKIKVKKIKHPYDQGSLAINGLDF